jgi:hypothetical protein
MFSTADVAPAAVGLKVTVKVQVLPAPNAAALHRSLPIAN